MAYTETLYNQLDLWSNAFLQQGLHPDNVLSHIQRQDVAKSVHLRPPRLDGGNVLDDRYLLSSKSPLTSSIMDH
jgi:hypothetical protein